MPRPGRLALLVALALLLPACSMHQGQLSFRGRRHHHSRHVAEDDPTRNPLFLPFVLLGLTRETGVAGGPNDEAARARLRSAPIKAGYWCNLYPPP